MPVNGQRFLHLPLFPYQQVSQVDALGVVVGADQALLQLVHLGVHLKEGVAEQLQLVALFLPGLLAHIAVVQLPDGGVQLGAGPVGDGVSEAQGQQGHQQGKQQHAPQVLQDGTVWQHVPNHPSRRGGRGPAAELGPSPLPAPHASGSGGSPLLPGLVELYRGGVRYDREFLILRRGGHLHNQFPILSRQEDVLTGAEYPDIREHLVEVPLVHVDHHQVGPVPLLAADPHREQEGVHRNRFVLLHIVLRADLPQKTGRFPVSQDLVEGLGVQHGLLPGVGRRDEPPVPVVVQGDIAEIGVGRPQLPQGDGRLALMDAVDLGGGQKLGGVRVREHLVHDGRHGFI